MESSRPTCVSILGTHSSSHLPLGGGRVAVCWGDSGCERLGVGLALVIFPQSGVGSRVGPGPAPPVLVRKGTPRKGGIKDVAQRPG